MTRTRGTTLGQSVFRELLREIREGRLRVGDRLPSEADLMERFGVGRNTIREALNSLAVMGVLDVRPGRGATVLAASADSPLDADTVAVLLQEDAIDDLLELRELLEIDLAGRAAERATEADGERLEAAIDHCRFAAEQGLTIYHADLEFHQALSAAARDTTYERVLTAAADLLRHTLSSMEHTPGHTEIVLEQHGAIAAAVATHDGPAARAAMAEHLRAAREAIAAARQRYKSSADGP
jgi:GntR family transcriptional regulator, transcriptional repressor for pyruvate dehydrogenase complex